MPDFMDLVQQRCQVDLELHLAKATEKRQGASHCDDCGAGVSPLRQSMGARLCLPHQEQVEQAQRRRR